MNDGSGLGKFTAYVKAGELFDLVISDMNEWLGDLKLSRLVSQQIASADSVCANMEEGFGRESKVEYRRFLVISRGSLKETMGRYNRMRHWIPDKVVAQRQALMEEISRILTATIRTLKNS
jgi:four helix bundle protein